MLNDEDRERADFKHEIENIKRRPRRRLRWPLHFEEWLFGVHLKWRGFFR